jgi:hypothetical protein
LLLKLASPSGPFFTTCRQRDVFFDWEAAFSEALMTAIESAPKVLVRWHTLLFAFDLVKPM